MPRNGNYPHTEHVVGDTAAAVKFLRHWPVRLLTAISPVDRKIGTQRFALDQDREAADWIAHWQGRRNIYYSLNTPREGVSGKASKIDIVAVTALHVDLDPVEGGDLATEQAKNLERLQAFEPTPSLIIFSGSVIRRFGCSRNLFRSAAPRMPSASRRSIADWRWRSAPITVSILIALCAFLGQ